MGDTATASAMQNVAVESGKAMASAQKGAGGDKDKGETEMFRVNQIYYRMIPTLSLVAKRTLIQNYAQKNTYTGVNDTIVFIMNTGEFYTSMSTSYLYMQVGFNNPANYHTAKALIAQGNAMQLFEEVTFISSSGTEICRELNKGLQHSFDYRYNNTQEYIDTIGQIQGAPTGKYHQLHDGVAPVYLNVDGTANTKLQQVFPAAGGTEGLVLPRSGSAARAQFGTAATNLNLYTQDIGAPGTPAPNFVEVIIPMDHILGLFKPYMNVLFPAALLAGSRLEFRLKNLTESLQFIGPAIPIINNGGAFPDTGNTQVGNLIANMNSSFTINRIYLTLDAFQLGENVLRRLNETSAGEDGLSMLFNTYDHVITNVNAAGTQEVMVSQARSRIIRSYNIVRNSMFLSNPYINSMAAECAEIGRIAAKVPLGSENTYPPVAVPNVNNRGWGGGITYRSLVGTAADSNGGPFSGTIVEYPFPLQPRLPDDENGVVRKPTVESYQAQLGSLFFPQQPINTNPEHYQNALYMWGKCIPDKNSSCSVSYEDFLGGQGAGLYPGSYPNVAVVSTTPVDPTLNSSYGAWVAPYGLAVYGMLAEKSQALQLSGLPISNARLLKHRFIFSANPKVGTTRTISTITEYTRVVKVFMGGRAVVRE